jgi:hypothetical protein
MTLDQRAMLGLDAVNLITAVVRDDEDQANRIVGLHHDNGARVALLVADGDRDYGQHDRVRT